MQVLFTDNTRWNEAVKYVSLAKTSTGLKAIFESCFQEHQVKTYQSLCIPIEEANVKQLKTIMDLFFED